MVTAMGFFIPRGKGWPSGSVRPVAKTRKRAADAEGLGMPVQVVMTQSVCPSVFGASWTPWRKGEWPRLLWKSSRALNLERCAVLPQRRGSSAGMQILLMEKRRSPELRKSLFYIGKKKILCWTVRSGPDPTLKERDRGELSCADD